MRLRIKADRLAVQRGGYGVVKTLQVFGQLAPDVFWSDRSNSYVVVNEPAGPRILSINGLGEIRWRVEEWNRDDESQAAIAYFLEVAE